MGNARVSAIRPPALAQQRENENLSCPTRARRCRCGLKYLLQVLLHHLDIGLATVHNCDYRCLGRALHTRAAGRHQMRIVSPELGVVSPELGVTGTRRNASTRY